MGRDEQGDLLAIEVAGGVREDVEHLGERRARRWRVNPGRARPAEADAQGSIRDFVDESDGVDVRHRGRVEAGGDGEEKVRHGCPVVNGRWRPVETAGGRWEGPVAPPEPWTSAAKSAG